MSEITDGTLGFKNAVVTIEELKARVTALEQLVDKREERAFHAGFAIGWDSRSYVPDEEFKKYREVIHGPSTS